MHLSLKSGLGKLQGFLSRVLSGRVLDLFESFTQDNTTVSDSSGEGNDATLYSGRYISTDGSTDRGIVADCSAAGAGNYYLTGKVRPNAVTTAELTMDGSTDSGLTGLTADVWQTFTTATSAVTPSAVQVGYDGSTASAADWSDVRLIDSSDGSTVARWQLNESADGDLDGYPALDSSGNGYHGTHVGCAGGTGEGIDSDVVGDAFAANEDKMYFDGVDDRVTLDSAAVSDNSDFDITAKATLSFGSYAGLPTLLGNSTGTDKFVGRVTNSTTIGLRTNVGSIINITPDVPLLEGVEYTYRFVRSGTTVSLYIDGALQSSSWTIGAAEIFLLNQIGANFSNSTPWNGVIHSVDFGQGTTWDGTIADGDAIGTVNGSPVTVGQKRETILQTAGMDWNKRMWFDGVDDYILLDSTETLSGDFFIEISGDFRNTTLASKLLGGSRSVVRITSSTTIRIQIDLINYDFTVSDSVAWSTLRVERNGTDLDLILDGVPQTQKTGVSTADFPVDQIGRYVNENSTGFYSNVNLNDQLTWDGTQANAVANGWTVNGSPSNLLIPESDSTPSNDALGNTIAEPRPTADTWNLFGDGEYGRVADADSLDVTTAATWELWGNFNYDSSAADEFALDKTSYRIWKNNVPDNSRLYFSFAGAAYYIIVPDSLCSIHFVYKGATPSAVCYINGIAVAPIFAAGVLGSSISVNTDPLKIGNDIAGIGFYKRKISRPKIYNRALTADEVLQNFNAQKSSFGL